MPDSNVDPDITTERAEQLAVAAGRAADLLKVMANEGRLRVLCLLCEGERSVSELTEAVGLSQSALSQHLARLRSAGVVDTRRDAQTIYYRLASPEARRIMGVLYDAFCASEGDGD